jgi:membrane protein implicated in regulation of membrane protease activity
MNDFLKMDIFFVVTTVVAVVFGVLGATLLWRLERILKNVEHISEQVAMGSDALRQDLIELRNDIKYGEGRLKSLFSFLNVFSEKKSSKKSSKKS